MSETEAKPQKRSNRRYILLLSAVVIVVAGWSGAWFYGRSVLADQLDLQMGRMARNGLTLACSGLEIGGYPFRYEVACEEMRSEDRRGTQGSLGALNAVALVYNPWHVIFEARSPAAVSVPLSGLSGDLTWDTARASMKFSQASLGAMDAVVRNPEATFENPLLGGLISADKAEFHLRQMPDRPGALEGYLSLDALALQSVPELRDTLDIKSQARIAGGAALVAGADLATVVKANDGTLPVELVLFQVMLDQSRVAARGDLVVNGDGTLSGKLDLAIGNATALLKTLKPLLPPQDSTVSVLEGIVKSLEPAAREVDGLPTIDLTVAIDNGVVRIGFLPVLRIPPLFQAGT
ncbi:DUF2125 domain-containing protein [Roseibium aggregatum]|uniref:DUF2125 domain-containing protein n=1 Tax=Roseibium aggregatum TaxID=187304 RepID=A0A939J6Y2_9HYPH|nr:DUF2125 domain-containing protein [Roseibium aggregatum]MBN9673259.1 DUF2125 domain-containing protein [Roseibium aggregatum]